MAESGFSGLGKSREEWLQHREGNVYGWESELAAAKTIRRRAHEHPAPTAVFSALADDTRWAILTRLGQSPASASALARELPVSRQAIVKHLEVLRGAGLVEAETQGRELVHRALGGRLSPRGPRPRPDRRDLGPPARGPQAPRGGGRVSPSAQPRRRNIVQWLTSAVRS